MLYVHARNFSRAKVSPQVSLSPQAIPSRVQILAAWGMTHDAETPAEKAEHRRNMLDGQREVLQHVPAWLRFRGLTQRQAAEWLGVTEASFSKWLSGTDAMKVGFLRRLAELLKAEPGDLIAAPPAGRMLPAVADLMDAAEGLSPDQLRILSETARMMGRKPAA